MGRFEYYISLTRRYLKSRSLKKLESRLIHTHILSIDFQCFKKGRKNVYSILIRKETFKTIYQLSCFMETLYSLNLVQVYTRYFLGSHQILSRFTLGLIQVYTRSCLGITAVLTLSTIALDSRTDLPKVNFLKHNDVWTFIQIFGNLSRYLDIYDLDIWTFIQIFGYLSRCLNIYLDI